jgi:hypothetical protein
MNYDECSTAVGCFYDSSDISGTSACHQVPLRQHCTEATSDDEAKYFAASTTQYNDVCIWISEYGYAVSDCSKLNATECVFEKYCDWTTSCVLKGQPTDDAYHNSVAFDCYSTAWDYKCNYFNTLIPKQDGSAGTETVCRWINKTYTQIGKCVPFCNALPFADITTPGYEQFSCSRNAYCEHDEEEGECYVGDEKVTNCANALKKGQCNSNNDSTHPACRWEGDECVSACVGLEYLDCTVTYAPWCSYNFSESGEGSCEDVTLVNYCHEAKDERETALYRSVLGYECQWDGINCIMATIFR